MNTSESQATTAPDIQQLLGLRFTDAQFTLVEYASRPIDVTAVSEFYITELLASGFVFSHEITILSCIGKPTRTAARMLVYLNTDSGAYAILTDLYHEKFWVYFTNYFDGDKRLITTCQPGTLKLEPLGELSSSTGIHLHNTGSCGLKAQWKKHQHQLAVLFADERPLLMDPHQHLDAERQAYRTYSELLLDCTVLRQTDTQMFGFTQTGARTYLAALTSQSAKRPKPKTNTRVSKPDKPKTGFSYRNIALFASAAISALIVFNASSYFGNTEPETPDVAVLPADETTNEITAENNTVPPTEPQQALDDTAIALYTPDPNEKPEQFIVASEEDEMWRIAVENAEFYLMSNDGDPAPWIRTARKMAAGFKKDDPRIARTYFLAALLERDERVAEQQYNRALSIQTKTLGLYHAETAQTLEALAWIAEGTRDDLEEAITHQKLALNVYRSIFGEEAEDTRAARWKLQYFEDRLAGRRPKSKDNRRLLPALAKFAH